MKSYLSPKFLLLLVSINWGLVNSADPTCKAALSAILKFQMGQIGVCTKELGFKGKEKSEKMNCIMKCVMVSTGALLPDGGFDLESAMKFVLSNIPMDYIYKAVVEGRKCQVAIGGSLDNKDPLCKSYEPLVKCLTNFAMNLCNK